MKKLHLHYSVILLLLAGLCMVLLAPSRLAAQTISGYVTCDSTWGNDVLNPPGDGSGNGQAIVGIWSAGGSIVGPPLDSNVLTAVVSLPLAGDPGAYSLGSTLPDGSYSVVAWIDGDGDQQYDEGEPRNIPQDATISEGESVAGFNVEIVDDSDLDNMDDWWEVHWFNDLDETGATDFDRDGLLNQQEFNIAINNSGTLLGGFLAPTDWDTDGDLMDDKWEWDNHAVGTGTDPTTNDWAMDPDGDGLLNAQEYNGIDDTPRLKQDPGEAPGIAQSAGSGDHLSPIDVDTDDDSLIDSFEAAWNKGGTGTNPKSAENAAGDPDQDGLTSYREQCLLLELREGGTNDIWLQGRIALPDTDGNGLRDFSPPLALGATQPKIGDDFAALQNQEWTDPRSADTDVDLLPDGWEVEHGLDPCDDGSTVFDNGFGGDPDGDNLINSQEYYGQDGDRASSQPYINGTGDETNPNQHNWRPISTFPGAGVARGDYYYVSTNFWTVGGGVPGTNTTLGAALPTISLGADTGTDTDDDGRNDDTEIQEQYAGSDVGTSPVHSMHPFIRRSALITAAGGMVIPDPEGSPAGGYRPLLHRRDWTVECMVKLNTTGRSGYLVNCPGPTNGLVCFRLELTNDVPKISFDTLSGFRYAVSGLAIPANQWVHIAGVWDHAANSLALYIDGIFVQEQQIYEDGLCNRTFTSWRAPTIGESPDASFVNQVRMDEVRIWGVARTPAQVETYRTKLVPQDSTGLLAYYRFDDGGTTAEDFARKAQCGLQNAVSMDRTYGDFGFALTAGYGPDSNDFARIRGVDVRGADDSDGDGMPDGWEMINHLDPYSAAGNDGATGDPDGDQLHNIYEYWSRTNPNAEDTDTDSVLDREEDLDGDGVVNLIEQQEDSRPDMIDTDDDSVTDSDELNNGSSPADPADPVSALCMEFDGAATDYVRIPNSLYQRLPSWTLEAWVNPASTLGGEGTIIRRSVQALGGGVNAVNYELGLDEVGGTLEVYAGYRTVGGLLFRAQAGDLPAGEWTHLAASYDAVTSILRVYTNGIMIAGLTNSEAPPLNGKGGETFVRLGENYNGLIDEMRIWKSVRTSVQITDNLDGTVDGASANLVNYLRFDDAQATDATFAFGQYHQPHGPQDFTFTRDWMVEWVHAGEMVNNVRFSTETAIIAPAGLRVNLEPPEAVIDGAQWQAQGLGSWRDSGEQVQFPDQINPTVDILYKGLTDWVAPPNESLTLTNGMTITITRTYAQRGSMQVFIEPAEARSGGGQWRVDGGTWLSSGVIVSNIAAGAHVVSFSDVGGWMKPSDTNLTVLGGNTTYHTAYYTEEFGSPSLRVHIEPAAIIALGAQWRINDGSWLDSDFLMTGLSVGTNYVVTFREIEDWITPTTFSTTFTANVLADLTKTYYQAEAIGRFGQGLGEFNVPRGMAAGAGGKVYVADSGNHRVQVYNRITRSWSAWGGRGSMPGLFNQPFDVAVGPDETVYVADANNHRIQRFNAAGAFLQQWGTHGLGLGQFEGPFGVAVDSLGNVYVADHYNNRVQKRHAATGQWSIFAGPGFDPGEVRTPNGVAVDEHDNVYVTDHALPDGPSRVQKFTRDGAFLEVIGSSTDDGLNRPTGLAAGGSTNLFVCDTGTSRVMERNAAGNWGEFFGGGVVISPEGVVEDVFRNVYVADTGNHRLLRFGNEGPLFAPGNAVDDFDGDGRTDPWRYNQAVGTWYLLGSSLDFAFVQFGWWAAAPVQADYDGDGKTDLAVFGPGGMWYILRSTAGYTQVQFGWDGPTPVPADYDADGRADVAVYDQPSGTWYLLRSQDGFFAQQFGWSQAAPVPADYDNDNRADLAVFGPGATWYILGSASPFAARQFGWDGPWRVPADYDGDGSADLALYDQPSGTWYIMRSTLGFTVRQFGWSGAVPVPGDYDGDGFTDIAVYGNGAWYIMGSTAGFWIQQFP